jgi:hypothetical protein
MIEQFQQKMKIEFEEKNPKEDVMQFLSITDDQI